MVLDTHQLRNLDSLSEPVVEVVLDTYYSLSWLMYHVDFERLRAKCGLCDHWKFLTQVRSMRPFGICELMVQCGNQYSLLIAQIVYVCISHCITRICYVCELIEFADFSLNVNGPNMLCNHVTCYL